MQNITKEISLTPDEVIWDTHYSDLCMQYAACTVDPLSNPDILGREESVLTITVKIKGGFNPSVVV